MMFDEPVLLQLGWWYVAWARVSGPSSDCGSHGQATITTDDGYTNIYFMFLSFLKDKLKNDVSNIDNVKLVAVVIGLLSYF